MLIPKMKNYIENSIVYISPSKIKILNIFWSCWTCLLFNFPIVTGKYVLHPTFAVRMYHFYGYFNAFVAGIALFSFISSK